MHCRDDEGDADDDDDDDDDDDGDADDDGDVCPCDAAQSPLNESATSDNWLLAGSPGQPINVHHQCDEHLADDNAMAQNVMH